MMTAFYTDQGGTQSQRFVITISCYYYYTLYKNLARVCNLVVRALEAGPLDKNFPGRRDYVLQV